MGKSLGTRWEHQTTPFRSLNGSFDAVISNGSLHHWLDPVAVFNGIARLLKPFGILAIQDGRRDLGFGGRLLVHALMTITRLDPSVPRGMREGWKSSIAAGYTPGVRQSGARQRG